MLGHSGFGTRSQIKQLVKLGAVTINGQRAKDPGVQIDPNRDVIALDGEKVRYRETVYVMMHKPAGIVSATEDRRDKTVVDLLNGEIAVFSPFPVGRLDKDTEGLLLLTNDGKLSHELLSPRKHVPKTYEALVAGDVGTADAAAFEQGVQLDDGYVTMPAQLRTLEVVDSCDPASLATKHPDMQRAIERTAQLPETDSSLSWIELTIHEGKFHQVKRMFEAVEKKVLYLRRVAMGPLALDESLSPGQWRELTEAEVEMLRAYRS